LAWSAEADPDEELVGRRSLSREFELQGKALMHGHCHQEALFGVEGERGLLERAGLEVELLNAGCCGLAGSFGYQAGDPYTVSMQAGEGCCCRRCGPRRSTP